MKDISTFYPLIEPYVIGCPVPLMNQAVLRSAIEFCRRTNAVQEIGTQDITADTTEYDIDVPTSSQLTCIVGVWVGGKKIDPVATDSVESGTAMRGNIGQDEVPPGNSTCYYQRLPSDSVIYLWPSPTDTITDGLAIKAAFEPTQAATSLADVLWTYHADAIAYGALAYLMSLPGQSFSNPTSAVDFRTRFITSAEKAKSAARTGLVRNSLFVRPRAFA